jgi:hypothetical protein
MLTQCPKCQKTQEIPDHYKGQLIKCLHCKAQFAAADFEMVPDIQGLPRKKTKAELFEKLLGAFFLAIGGLGVAILTAILWLSIIGCGINGIIESQPNTYLLAVCAICLLIIASKK